MNRHLEGAIVVVSCVAALTGLGDAALCAIPLALHAVCPTPMFGLTPEGWAHLYGGLGLFAASGATTVFIVLRRARVTDPAARADARPRSRRSPFA
jgi:hypothetical protein